MRRTRFFLTASLLLAACKHQDDGKAKAAAPVPVEAQSVERKSVPIYLDGIGSATALYTVTVHTRVDGELLNVAFKEGQKVKKGDLLVQLDPRPFEIQLKTAQAQLAKDQAALKDDQLNLDRDKTLREGNLIQQQTVDDQQALVDQTLAAAKSDEAAMDNAKLQLIYAHVTSPIDGVTGIRQVDPGNIVHATDVGGVVVITQLDPIAVIFVLPEDNLPEVAEAMHKGPVTVEAYGRDGKEKLAEGKVLLVDNQINQTTGTIKLKALMPNPDNKLWPNEFVKARLLLETRDNAIVIPQVAMQRGPNGTFVYVIKSDSTVEARPITVDTIQGDTVIVSKGLDVGEQIVTDGQYKLRVGAKVSAAKRKAGPASQPAAGGSSTGPAQDSAR